ncbi:hypothetical protein B0H13DRAFT_1936100 [Mycena leptocephala]|nr:hypothetical protein B0H13DRAFT_1936100 [Mycena leptocephala]
MPLAMSRLLGLRIQLNHLLGVVCPYRQAAPHNFVLYDLMGVHELNVDFADARTSLALHGWSRAFSCCTLIINCLGKLSAYDFLRGLEMCMNHDGLDKLPDCQKPFMHIVRQWREVKQMKRGKRGHKPGGVRGTAQGELALMCRHQFSLVESILGDRFGYFCKRERENRYKAHIAKHANEKEISNCSGFQAMFLANTKRVKGLRTMGIGGVTCTWHNMWRPNGMGNLQVVVWGFALLCLVVSYDIGCQFSINFWKQMEEMPEGFHLKLAAKDLWWKVPNFHLLPHKLPCYPPFSFHWMWGAGMTHGEGVEQNCHKKHEIELCSTIVCSQCRSAVDIKAGLKHKVAFKAFMKGLQEFRPAEVLEWKEWVERWEAEQHTTAKDSPFEVLEEVTSLWDIQVKIAMEEFMCMDDGVEVEREHMPGTFISMGLELEEVQYAFI